MTTLSATVSTSASAGAACLSCNGSAAGAIPSVDLLVQDVDGQYRPAQAEEVLSQARQVLAQRVRSGAMMSSPQSVKDYLRLEIGVSGQ